jgi:hypothetical protein
MLIGQMSNKSDVKQDDMEACWHAGLCLNKKTVYRYMVYSVGKALALLRFAIFPVLGCLLLWGGRTQGPFSTVASSMKWVALCKPSGATPLTICNHHQPAKRLDDSGKFA